MTFVLYPNDVHVFVIGVAFRQYPAFSPSASFHRSVFVCCLFPVLLLIPPDRLLAVLGCTIFHRHTQIHGSMVVSTGWKVRQRGCKQQWLVGCGGSMTTTPVSPSHTIYFGTAVLQLMYLFGSKLNVAHECSDHDGLTTPTPSIEVGCYPPYSQPPRALLSWEYGTLCRSEAHSSPLFFHHRVSLAFSCYIYT